MSKSVTITLQQAIQAHGDEITEITIEPPRAKHLRAMPVKSVMDMGDLLDLAGVCAGLPKSSVDQLCAADALRVIEVIGGFLGGDTGAKPLS